MCIRDREEGAHEVDYVLNIGKLLDADGAYIEEEMKRIVAQCHDRDAVCKVILENCYLDKQAKVLACEIALRTGCLLYTSWIWPKRRVIWSLPRITVSSAVWVPQWLRCSASSPWQACAASASTTPSA